MTEWRTHYGSAEAIGRIESAPPVRRTGEGENAKLVARIQLDIGGASVTVSFWGPASEHIRERAAAAIGATMRAWGRLAQWGDGAYASIDVQANDEGGRPNALSGYALLGQEAAFHCGWVVSGRLDEIALDARSVHPIATITAITPAAERNGRFYPERRNTYKIACETHIAAALRTLPRGSDVKLRGTFDDAIETDGYGQPLRRGPLAATEILEPQIAAPAPEQRPAKPGGPGKTATILRRARAVLSGNGEAVPAHRPARTPFRERAGR
jgi:hypothetical protein